jgi:hypothetical protein
VSSPFSVGSQVAEQKDTGLKVAKTVSTADSKESNEKSWTQNTLLTTRGKAVFGNVINALKAKPITSPLQPSRFTGQKQSGDITTENFFCRYPNIF